MVLARVPRVAEGVRLTSQFDRDHLPKLRLAGKVRLHLVEGDEAALELREHKVRRLNLDVWKVAVDELAPVDLAVLDRRLAEVAGDEGAVDEPRIADRAALEANVCERAVAEEA